MADQNYGNHAKFVPLYHFFLAGLVLVTLVGAGVNLFVSIRRGQPLYDPALLFAISVCGVFFFLYSRVFALKAQDRAIRAEENFRHYLLTGSPLSPKLRTRQIIGLRFAPDEELPALAQRAAAEGLSEKEIKQAVKNWKADHYRV